MILKATQWNGLVRDLGPRLFRYFRASFAGDVADELVQETLYRLFRKIEDKSYSKAEGSINAYAFGIAYLIRLERLKILTKSGGDREVVEEMAFYSSASAEGEYLKKEAASRLRQAILKLTSQEQDVVTLLIDKELSLNEISNILGSPLNTIKSHVHRAKENLKKLLSED